MDIQKEEDDFNAWFNKQTINAVPDADLSLQRLWASLAWQAQAAKTQVVPEGFVLINKESLALHTQSIRMFNNGEDYIEEIEEHVCSIEDMIEAREPTND